MLTKWIKYYKKSILDGLRREIKLSGTSTRYVQDFDIEKTQISVEDANWFVDKVEVRLNRKNGITQTTNPKWESVSETTVLISPFYLQQIPTDGYPFAAVNQRPFYYLVNVNRAGKLSMPEETFPIFQRRFLEPVATGMGELVLSTTDLVDEAMTLSGLSEHDGYEEYIMYLTRIFSKVTDQEITEYTSDGFQRVNHAALVLPEEDIYAAMSIVSLYEGLLSVHDGNNLPLLNAVLAGARNFKSAIPVKKLIDAELHHLGQMTNSFPLSPSQRRALATYNKYSAEKVFAINGPPGTGKTTTLQSLVANEVVKAVIDGGEAPLIVATSNNNQAVTNILDSFTIVASSDSLLTERWISFVNGYGCYLPKMNATNAVLNGYNYHKLNGEGLFEIERNTILLNKEKSHYLNKVEEYLGQSKGLDQSIDSLQQLVREKSKVIKSLSGKWKNKIQGDQELKSYSSITSKSIGFSTLHLIDEEIERLEQLESTVKEYFDNEPWWLSLFVFFGFKFAQNKRVSRLSIILRESHIDVTADNCSESYVLGCINEPVKLLIRAKTNYEQWNYYLKSNGLKGIIPTNAAEYYDLQNPYSPNKCIFDQLDTSIRNELFHLAIHYWEGRWLKSALNLGTENNGERAVKSKWIRRAMLTPCFVTTYYMMPKFFSYSVYQGLDDIGKQRWLNGYLYDFIDLLIVDEAGQVSPEIGTASFALAKKAMIVGDVQQIEPIWNIQPAIDIGNLRSTQILEKTSEQQQFDQYENQGKLSSKGSVMKMALHSTSLIDENGKDKGVILLEHRRCYNEIIQYCNSLAYGGVLRPMRGAAPDTNLFPPMLQINSTGKSDTHYRSRFNSGEANQIASWLISNQASIIERYGRIEKSVGIITPFVAQKREIIRRLKASGFNTDIMTIGTVHSLQGAERPIIIFSAVYNVGDVDTMFFDRGVNMLNVAVSRAKDTFICFSSENLFDRNSQSPSGILARDLTFF